MGAPGKILLITKEFPNIFGGVSDHSHHLCAALANMGLDISVLTSNNENIIKNNKNSFEILATIKKWNILGIVRILRQIKEANLSLKILALI